jgi:AcrR family transcriptional regulator
MISYYFHNKEGLYRECFQEIAHQRLRQARDILLPAVSRAQYQDRLGRMIDSLFTLYLEDRDAGLIIIREYDRTTSPAADLLRDTFDQVQKLMIDFFRRAQRHGFAEKSADPFMMASIFLGAIVSHMRMDHIHKRVHGRSLRSPRERAKLKSALVEMFSR